MSDSVNKPRCIFGNIQDFWQDILKSKLDNIRQNNLVDRVLLPLVKSGEAIKKDAFCHSCQRVHSAEEADLHKAGTHCTAFSRKGLHQMLEDITVMDLMAWIGQRRLIQERIICQENVEDFPSEKILEWLGDLYDIQVILLCPSDLGWGIRRRRKFHIMRHKYKAGPMSCPLHVFAHLFVTEEEKQLLKKKTSSLLPEWDMYFVATPDELTDEMEWAMSRDKSQQKLNDQGSVNWKDMTPGGAYEMCLNNFEFGQLQKYREQWPAQCYQLNQSFDQQATHSSDLYLPTIIKNAGIIWPFGLILNI